MTVQLLGSRRTHVLHSENVVMRFIVHADFEVVGPLCILVHVECTIVHRFQISWD